ncbi:MAG: hypothetical protein MUD10_00460 [Candidatus Pacebacteria bacterium]|jgi:hypothetical protein|nr:hypothetical protein [Candidatus Paceibacterota bacterium]
MNNLIIVILFSLIAMTFVIMALIPQMVIPDFYDSVAIRKPAPKTETKPEPKNVSTVPDGGCGAAAYGMDCKVTGYLENNLVKPLKDGQVFCSYDKISEVEVSGSDAASDLVYLKYQCQEFYSAAGFIYEGSGQAGPAKVIISVNKTGEVSMSHWLPRDGGYFTADVGAEFPEDIQPEALSPVKESLAQINRERAQSALKAQFDFSVEKNTEAACSYDFECVTPGEYLMMSRCPFTSKCIGGKCAVVCINAVKTGLP